MAMKSITTTITTTMKCYNHWINLTVRGGYALYQVIQAGSVIEVKGEYGITLNIGPKTAEF